MRLSSIRICFSRWVAALVSFVCGGIVYGVLDAMYWHRLGLNRLPPQDGFLWVFLGIFVAGTLIALKNAIAPNLIFAADAKGIQLGRGLLINKVHKVNWEQLVRIEEGTIELSHHLRNPEMVGRPKRIPAAKLTFDRTVKLGSVGYTVAHPRNQRTYLIAAHLFHKSLPEVIAHLKGLKDLYSEA